MGREIKLLFTTKQMDPCAIAISQLNSYFYITSSTCTSIYSERGRYLCDFNRGDNCFGISIYDSIVYVSCISQRGVGCVKVFTLDGYFITEIRQFKIKYKTYEITKPFGLLIDVFRGDLALFLSLTTSNHLYCSTDYASYTVCDKKLYKPRDIKACNSKLYVLLGQVYNPIIILNKCDMDKIISVIHPGLGELRIPQFIESRSNSLSNLHYFSIDQERDRLYIFKFMECSLHIYTLTGRLVDMLHSDFLDARNDSLRHGLATTKEGFIYVLVDSLVVWISQV